jgi:hypothetical protein
MRRRNVPKKVVRVESDPESKTSEPAWKPTPEAKQQATRLRIIAVILWLVAIAGEAFAIFWVLKQSSVNLVVLIVAIVVIGVLSVVGSLLWKRANRADPASTSDPVRFFIQNQLGAIIAAIAFLPLIVMILLNQNMDGKQKGIAGGLAVVVLAVAAFAGASFDSPSVQQYDAETNQVIQYTGRDLVFWTKAGSVYHLCQDASAVNLTSKDNTIYSGTVGDAHADGKERLTLQVDQELKQCGYAAPTPGNS